MLVGRRGAALAVAAGTSAEARRTVPRRIARQLRGALLSCVRAADMRAAAFSRAVVCCDVVAHVYHAPRALAVRIISTAGAPALFFGGAGDGHRPVACPAAPLRIRGSPSRGRCQSGRRCAADCRTAPSICGLPVRTALPSRIRARATRRAQPFRAARRFELRRERRALAT